MAHQNQIQFKNITKVFFRGDYFVFLAEQGIFSTDGRKVVNWDTKCCIGLVEDVFALTPGWIKFFKNSIKISKEQPLRRNAPMVQPWATRVVQVNVSRASDRQKTHKTEEYLVIPGK